MHPQTVKILGIDPGSQITGFCCLSQAYKLGSQPRIIDAGVIRPKLSLSHSDRLGQIHDGIHTIAGQHSPQIAVIEKGFTGINQHSALRLGETRGAIIAALRRLQIGIFEITPAEVKKIVTGKGHATKEEIALTIAVLLKFQRGKLPFDVTDAAAVAYSYAITEHLKNQASANLTPAY